jgi:hypothetical protein
LQDEANKAEEWRKSVEEAKTKGAEYASKAETKWYLSSVDNPMTDDKDYTVTSEQTNGKGAVAQVEGTCKRGERVVFTASLHDAAEIKDPKQHLVLPDYDGSYIAGNKRVNDDQQFATRFAKQKFNNVFVLSTLASSSPTESMETTWRVLAQIETGQGQLVVKIPMLDSNVQGLISACSKQVQTLQRSK